MENKIAIKTYNGPFEVLYKIISDKKISIEQINMVELTNEYLKIIEYLKKNNIDLSADFLFMMSHLLWLKSSFLAGTRIEKTNEEKKKLLSKLSEESSHKPLHNYLKETNEKNSKSFFIEEKNWEFFQKQKEKTKYKNGSIKDLEKAFEIFFYKRKQEEQIKKVELKLISIEDQINWILKKLKKNKKIIYNDLLKLDNINKFSITFLAILKLLNQKTISINEFENFKNLKITEL